MDRFFENRLSGYDEHMLTVIDGTGEFYRFTASLLPTKNAYFRDIPNKTKFLKND